jgi:hypothetical protein
MALMATWEITIACHDGSRLRFSDLKGHAPKKGEIIETAECRENNQSEDRRLSRKAVNWLPPSLFPGHGERT